MTTKQALALAFASLLGLAVACSNQSEGERCNSDDDCGANLTCVGRSSLAGEALICCPVGTSASSDLCNAGGSGDLVNPDAQGGVSDPDASSGDADASSEADASDSGHTSDSGEPVDGGETDASGDADADSP